MADKNMPKKSTKKAPKKTAAKKVAKTPKPQKGGSSY